MSVDELARLKKTVDSLGRKAVARAAGMHYSLLGAKLNGFTNFIGDDMKKLRAAIAIVNSQKLKPI